MSATCNSPLRLSTLLDYWLEGSVPDEVDAIEEHLLGCESCNRLLRSVVALGDGVSRLAHDGVVEMVVTPSFLARAAQEGLHTREYRAAPGDRVDCTVTSQDDLLVARLTADFRGLSRLDVVAEEEGGRAHRAADVPFNPAGTELIVAQAMPYMRALQHARVRIRLVAPEPAGERLIGEYTFVHTPSPG